MKTQILFVIAIIMTFLFPKVNFGQLPELGAASGFAIYTADGAFNLETADISVVTGDVGTNVGAFYGFPPGTLIGQKHLADPATAAAAPDVLAAFGYLSQLTCGMTLTTPLGGVGPVGQLFTPNIYCLTTAAELNNNITLDGQNNPDAIFIFKIDGAFATSTFANIYLVNSASLCNVYWQINGAFTLGDYSVFRGNVIANGAIHLLQGSELYGRALSTAGAIDLHNNIVSIGLSPTAATITANGATSLCAGNSVILSGNIDGTWSTGEVTPSITVYASGDYFITNTSLCGSITSNHVTITVNANPTVTVNSPAMCASEGSSATITATPLPAGIYNYAWTVPAGATDPGNVPGFIASVAGPYSVIITDPVTGCTGNNSGTLTINANPTVTVNSPAMCASEGSSATITATPLPAGLYNYAWTVPAGATDPGNVPGFIASVAGLYNVVITDPVTGCTGNNSGTLTVNANPLLVTHPQEACSPNKIDLTAPAVTEGSSLYGAVLSYWLDALATIPMPTPNIAGNGTYFIKATTGAGCYDIEQVLVTINPLPTVFTVTGGGTYCAGGIGLEIGLSGSQSGVVYTLALCERCPVLKSAGGNGGPISFGIQTIAGLYSVFAIDTTTYCSNGMYNCISINIDPLIPVSVSIAPSANPVPAEVGVTFTATPVNGGATPSYQWMVNGLNAGTNNAAFSYNPVNDDEVTVVLTSNAACTSGNPATSNPVIMIVEGIAANITVAGIIASGQTKCYNATQTLTVAGNGKYFIVGNGGSATMIAGQNIVYLAETTVQPGGYMHGMISDLYCGYKTALIPMVITETQGPAMKLQNVTFKIYPNPTSGNFTLEQKDVKAFDKVKVEVYGMCGERLITSDLYGEKKHEFGLSEFRQGIYFVKIIAGEYAETFKLIKTR